MRRLQSSCDTGTRVPACVHNVLPVMVFGMVQQRLDARLGEAPRSGIERLLLAPYDGLGIRVHVQILLELLPWEGVELLDASDCGSVELLTSAMLVKGSINLTGAEDYAFNLCRFFDGLAMLRIWDDPLKMRFASKVLNVGTRQGMAKQKLGKEENKCWTQSV